MSDGKPPEFSGEQFIAVHMGRWTGGDVEGLEEEFGVCVTLTRRATYAPGDQAGEEIWALVTAGMDEMLRRIVAVVVTDVQLPGNDTVLNRANAYIGDTANGFVEKLRLSDGGRAEPKRADWFRGRQQHADEAPAGLAQQLTFVGAKRWQRYDNL